MGETLFSQATRGLSIVTSTLCGGVVRVDDGRNTWLCEKAEWDSVRDNMMRREAHEIEASEAYRILMSRMGGPVAFSGDDVRPDEKSLIMRAVDAGVLSGENAERLFGVWVDA